jgi:hypothetical protein
VAASPNGAMRNLAAIAMGSAAAGFGWSAGRDIYRKGKEWVLPAVALAAVAGGSGYAAWNLSRGHREPSAGRTVGALAVAGGSLALCLTVLGAGSGNPSPGRPPSDPAAAVGLALLVHAASAVIGLLVGLGQRGKRTRAFAIERHNLDFMAREGIRDVGGREETYLDSAGTEMKLDDVRRDAMVFKLVGRRNARAYIDIDPDGRMLAYRPAP